MNVAALDGAFAQLTAAAMVDQAESLASASPSPWADQQVALAQAEQTRGSTVGQAAQDRAGGKGRERGQVSFLVQEPEKRPDPFSLLDELSKARSREDALETLSDIREKLLDGSLKINKATG